MTYKLSPDELPPPPPGSDTPLPEPGRRLRKVETVEIEGDLLCVHCAYNLRGLTIWGYKTSEYVGEEVLAYLPVPGEYIACADTQELTKGKAWSL